MNPPGLELQHHTGSEWRSSMGPLRLRQTLHLLPAVPLAHSAVWELGRRWQAPLQPHSADCTLRDLQPGQQRVGGATNSSGINHVV